MYVLYNKTLRKKQRGVFNTTLHAINSGIVKLSRRTKKATVYRGVAGGRLPTEFWTPNEHGVMGGVEMGFMSTTTERDVALGYAKGANKLGKWLFMIRMVRRARRRQPLRSRGRAPWQGMIDRGADVSFLSQFPGENEILFAPLVRAPLPCWRCVA